MTHSAERDIGGSGDLPVRCIRQRLVAEKRKEYSYPRRRKKARRPGFNRAFLTADTRDEDVERRLVEKCITCSIDKLRVRLSQPFSLLRGNVAGNEHARLLSPLSQLGNNIT